MKTPLRTELENLGSLITYKNEEGEDQCLGSLLHNPERGTFEPNFGKMDITKEEAEIHNKELDTALIKGLMENCEVGQGGNFYAEPTGSVYKITTWTGLEVGEALRNGRKIRLRLEDKAFEAKLPATDSSYVFFKRVA